MTIFPLTTAETGAVRESLLLSRNMMNRARKTKGHVDIDKNALTACGLDEGGGEVELVIVLNAWQTRFCGPAKRHLLVLFYVFEHEGRRSCSGCAQRKLAPARGPAWNARKHNLTGPSWQ